MEICVDHEGRCLCLPHNIRQVIHDFDDINKIKSKPAYARAVSGQNVTSSGHKSKDSLNFKPFVSPIIFWTFFFFFFVQ